MNEQENIIISRKTLGVIIAYITTIETIKLLQKQKEGLENLLSAWKTDVEKFLNEGLTNK